MSNNNNNDNSTDGFFQHFGQAVTEISRNEAVQAIAAEVTRVQKQQVDTLEEINHTLEHLVKLLKPWAEREKRKNMLEQDPDYLEQIIKQVQQDRKARKPKEKKRK
jgi:hypothetical protein